MCWGRAWLASRLTPLLQDQRSPAQFIALQKALSTDLLNEYITHIGSGLWAVPPGPTTGSYIGAELFA